MKSRARAWGQPGDSPALACCLFLLSVHVRSVHQPSAELFSHFDRLLLLAPGGRNVYFGPVGEDSRELVDYFMRAAVPAPFARPSPPGSLNPAVWMLNVVVGQAGADKSTVPPWDEVYKESALCAENTAVLAQLSHPSAEPPHFDHVFAASYKLQLLAVVHRLVVHFWRDVTYYGVKNIIMLTVGLVFGLTYRALDDSDEAGLIVTTQRAHTVADAHACARAAQQKREVGLSLARSQQSKSKQNCVELILSLIFFVFFLPLCVRSISFCCFSRSLPF
jgi:hypothetical protein